MGTLPFMQVDAFTTTPLAGNACAVVFDADALSPDRMLAIAREMNLSETAFVLRSDVADVRARYFTPAEEIPLAGHPTIATIHALVCSDRLPLKGSRTRVTLELEVGPITVDIEAEDGVVGDIWMSQNPPEFLSQYPSDEVLPAFGLTAEDALPGVPIQTVSTGTPQLMVPVADQQALKRVRLDVAAYEALRRRGDFFSPHLFCLGGFTDEGDTSARHFGVPPDVMEDPFTGSATGGMAAYLWRYGLIRKPTFVAEQGHWMKRPGRASVQVVGPPDNIETVKVGGAAVLVMQGELLI
jgi:trans-2,3-dihydro-3-hydroxyanthranilate isomerase